MSDAKHHVIAALQHVGNLHKELAKAHRNANDAIHTYAQSLDHADNPLAILATFPAIFEGVGAVDKKGKAVKAEGDAAGTKRKRAPAKEKKEKDPNAPKRPPSAYIEYQNSVREDFRKQYSDLPYSEVLKKIGQMWQSMTDAEKKSWQNITEEKKSQYMKAKELYESTGEGLAAAAAAAEKKEPKKRKTKATAAAEPEDIPVEDVSNKKKKAASPSKKVESESESDDDEDSDSDEAESSEEESSEEEPTPPKKQKGGDKHKSKKSKH
ncbi:hypothetical protein JCM10295v2_000479 [Rhodotorula toruloides]